MADSSNVPDLPTTIAILTFGGFAIQRALEILDGPIAAISKAAAGSRSDESITKLKTFIMGSLAVAFAYWIVDLSDLDILKVFGGEGSKIDKTLGFVFSVLVLSAGTEAVNIVTKNFDYAKKVKKAALPPAPAESQAGEGNS